MKLYYKGNEQAFSDRASLIEKIFVLHKEAIDTGLIFELTVNDQPFSQEVSYLKFVSDIEKVEVEMKKPLEVVLEGMVEAINYLPRLINGLETVTVKFQTNKINEGVGLFAQAIEGLNWFHTIIQGIINYIDSGLVDQSIQKNLAPQINEYNSILNEVLGGWENEDYTLIGDLIEYELIPQIENWNLTIHQILNQLSH